MSSHIPKHRLLSLTLSLILGLSIGIVLMVVLAPSPAEADAAFPENRGSPNPVELGDRSAQSIQQTSNLAAAQAVAGAVDLDSFWWISLDEDTTYSVAWGDVDGDGDLDLAVGNAGRNKVHLNEGGVLERVATWTSDDFMTTFSIAWGDVDDDGDLDLAAGNSGQNKVYLNQGGVLESTPSWTSIESDLTHSVAWGDVDGDGDLDLAVGNSGTQDSSCRCYRGASNKIYFNVGNTLSTTSIWTDPVQDSTLSVDWADVDGDGDLDLAVGNAPAYDDGSSSVVGGENKIYRNDGLDTNSDLQMTVVWTSTLASHTNDLVWGDFDGDGDPDLAAGNQGPFNSSCNCITSDENFLYQNVGGSLSVTPVWTSTETAISTSVMWGDVDGDSDLDLAVGDLGNNKIYFNQGSTLELSATWSSSDQYRTQTVAWGDVDGDGDLDLATGNDNVDPNTVYLNQGGVLDTTAWEFNDSDNTRSVAWGDADGDGDLDLAVGNIGSFDGGCGCYLGAGNKVFLNLGGVLQTAADNPWTSSDSDVTQSMAWGDMDGDGDLDLAVGNNGQQNKVYRNDGVDGMGNLQMTVVWSSGVANNTNSLAWGDMDGDGDLDLVVGDVQSVVSPLPIKVYLNEGGLLESTASWVSDDAHVTQVLAWGDMEGDGDLDLAVGIWGKNKLYLNEGGALEKTATWTSGDGDVTVSLAWGDVDGDGDLDLAAGSGVDPTKIYMNEGGMLETWPAWASRDSDNTRSIAWGDVDGDGDLDLAAGNSTANKIYLNDGGMLQREATWVSSDSDTTNSVAWGDVDGDGDLDLAAGNWTVSNKVYLNMRALHPNHLDQPPPSVSLGLNSEPVQTFANLPSTGLAPANFYAVPAIREDRFIPISYTLFHPAGEPFQRIRGLYSMDGGDNWFTAEPKSATNTTDLSTRIQLPTIAPNLTISDVHSTIQVVNSQAIIADLNVYISATHTWVGDLIFTLEHVDTGTSVTLIDQPGVPDSTFGCSGNDLNVVLDDEAVLPVEDECAGTTPTIDGTFSPNNPLSAFDGEILNGTWKLTITDAYTAGDNGTLLGWRLLPSAPKEHVFEWDTFASGFFGQSDNVVLRLEALPNQRPITNSVPGPFQRPFVSAQSYPFRVRGTQVQVFSGTVAVANEVAGALVYRLPKGETTGAQPMGGRATPFLTDHNGYLKGRGELKLGDQLVALLPVSATEKYTLYHASASPSLVGVDAFTVANPGVQQLAVSSDNPLLLFNLEVSLEWDARSDTTFLLELENSFKRASQVLYDVTNGQVALGDVTVYHNKQNWLSADMVMYARNNIRPRANQGGVVDEVTNDTGIAGVIENAFLPGQISMGPIWDPFGESQFDLGQDWWRTLAHELAHYLLFLPDNYVGIDASGLLSLDCSGSFMTNSTDDTYSEFLTSAEWSSDPDCLQTVAEQVTGRSDWETVTTFYNMLSGSSGNLGPMALPLDVTQTDFTDPGTFAQALAARNYDLRDAGTGEIVLAPLAQAYLIKTRGTSGDLTDDQMVNLGTSRAGGDRIKVRGAESGDRVCVTDLQSGTPRLGCEDVTATSASVSLADTPGWQPSILVSPVSSTTLEVSVELSQTVSGLNVQVYPATGSSDNPDLPVESSVAAMSTSDNLNFVQTVALDYPAFNGHARVWVPGADPELIAITEFTLDTGTWGGNVRAWAGGNVRAWAGGNVRAWAGAPSVSGDGQITVLNLEDPYDDTGVSTLQALTIVPELPDWLALVGQAYQVSVHSAFTPTVKRSVSFDYLQRDVPDGHEGDLSIYYFPDGGSEWQRLPTVLDEDDNRAAAQLPVGGGGAYALIATVELSGFEVGWNNFGYPIDDTRPITGALASIEGSYTSVYHYDPVSDTWLLYDATVPPEFDPLVNDLETLGFGKGYWLYATEPITPYLGIESSALRVPGGDDPSGIPATYYGNVTPTEDFAPEAGMVVLAMVGNVVCGESSLVAHNRQLAYKVQVRSDTEDGCGKAGQQVNFYVDGRLVAPQILWDNSRAQQLSLIPGNFIHYLPVIVR